jgi:tripartite-type tricarboxylate transporter receptor subunit TctC
MRIRNVLKSLIILTIIGFVSEFYASAQATSDYPVRPIQLLVGSAPGGSEDVRARAVAPKLGEVLGQPVVVVQKLGAANAVALGIAAKSKLHLRFYVGFAPFNAIHAEVRIQLY